MAVEPKPWKKAERIEPSTYSIMMAHFVHLDGVMWNRVQWLITIQMAAIAGSYALGDKEHDVAAGVVLCLCAFVTIILLMMMRRDEAIRDANIKKLKNFCHGFVFSPKLTMGAPLKGRQLNSILFFSFLILDLVGAVVYWDNPTMILSDKNAVTCHYKIIIADDDNLKFVYGK